MIQLRNPWGSTEWKGRWSDTSPLWTAEAKDFLNYDNKNHSNDGIFWMPYDKFFQRYSTTMINYLRPDYFYSSQPIKNASNLVVRFKASDLKHGFVMVAQPDHRKKGISDNVPYNVCHLIGACC